MFIKTSNANLIKPFLDKLYKPTFDSHKGQNGRVLIIGGSSLFHAASIWAAEIASHFVDIVHYSSTKENNEIILSLKKKFRNGIVIAQKNLLSYIEEDDAILLGSGMMRKDKPSNSIPKIKDFNQLLEIKDEGEYTYLLTKYLIDNYPHKKFVFDAGSLQMMKPDWFLKFKEKPVITPHAREFERLFEEIIMDKNTSKKMEIATKMAKKYNCQILLKVGVDIITNGDKTVVIEGGNAGLTKGGTGDVLAGLTLSLFSKNDSFYSTVIASYLLKMTADELFLSKGYWYNIDDIINNVPRVLFKLCK